MYFEGLVRKFTTLPSLSELRVFIELRDVLIAKITPVMEVFTSGVDVFYTSHWMIFYREPPFQNPVTKSFQHLNSTEATLLRELCSHLLQLFKKPHRVCFVQLLWLNPGDEVQKHLDSQQAFGFTKRLNIILCGSNIDYSCFKGKEEVNLPVAPGDLFELNNRSAHALKNPGDDLAMILVIDYIEDTSPTVKESQRRKLVHPLPHEDTWCSELVIWDYPHEL